MSPNTAPEPVGPSMKVPPKRKGNLLRWLQSASNYSSLNESPSEKEGKWGELDLRLSHKDALNESPSEKEGK